MKEAIKYFYVILVLGLILFGDYVGYKIIRETYNIEFSNITISQVIQLIFGLYCWYNTLYLFPKVKITI